MQQLNSGETGDSPRPSDVTQLLIQWSNGDERALDRLIPLVYEDLRGLAHRRLRSERSGHTLQTTSLVHEAYVRLVEADVTPRDRAHFFALAARAMRRILVDHARARLTDKRGGGAARVELDRVQIAIGDEDEALDILALHTALEALEAQDERKARVVELHLFAGLSYSETAAALGISEATVDRELRFAKRWLARAMSESDDAG